MSGKSDERENSVLGRSTLPENPVSAPEEVLAFDHVYEALSHRRRRCVCHALRDRRAWPLTDLAATVAAWEVDTLAGPVDDARRERTYLSLYHAHVPKLTALDVVAFDESTGTVSAACNADGVLAALEAVGTSLGGAHAAHAGSSGSPGDDER